MSGPPQAPGATALPPGEAAAVRDLLERIRGRRVLIYGDLVCDSYLHTRIDRVSREAPVLIVRYRDREFRAGGAANAARNVAALGGRAHPVGIVGGDEEGDAVVRLLRSDGSAAGGLVVRQRHPTATKTRILAGGPHGARQQVLRVDRAEPVPWSRSLADRLKRALEGALGKAHAVLVSDYGLGAVHPEVVRWLFAGAARRGLPRLLDSRFRLEELPGATLASPNEPELEEVAGEPLAGRPDALRSAGEALMRRLEMEALVVTQGSDGMTVLRADEDPAHLPVFGTDEVADVTGAGDTVAAALALGLAAGADPLEAARLATVAAGLVVMKQGTSTVTAAEIREGLESA